MVLRVNLDETAVCLYPGRAQGAVFVSRKRQREGGQRIATWKRRCCLTHVAVVCDRAELQAQMPQFIIGNERTFLVRDLGALRRACPPNVTLVRQKSAWNNAEVTAQIVRALAAVAHSLEARLGKVQVVLVLDAARIHYAPAALRACRASGVWLVVVPAKMTWLLQPLDTHAFALYKAWLKQAYQRARMTSSSASGDLHMSEFLPCVYGAIRHVLQGRRWDFAFERDGLGARQAQLGIRVRQRLALQGGVDVSTERPTDDQVRACLPRRAKLSPATLWTLYSEPVARPMALRLGPALRPAAAIVADASASARDPRTRAEHRLAAAAVVGASGAASSAGARGAVPPERPVVYGKTRSETLRMKASGI